MTTTQDDSELSFTIYRRHSPTCSHSRTGRRAFGCKCPIWGDGYIQGLRVLRKSLRTCDAAKANAKMARLVQACTEALREKSGDEADVDCGNTATADVQSQSSPISSPIAAPAAAKEDDPQAVANACKAFLANCKTNGLKDPTIRKYCNSLNHLIAFANEENLMRVGELKVIHIDKFRASRELKPITSQKELEVLRQFFEYSVARDLCETNVAQKIKGPKNVSPNDVEPYTQEEMGRILGATQKFGRNTYERKRAKAMVLTLRHTALRISDIAVLRRDRITLKDGVWRIFLHTTKNNKRIFLRVPREMKDALDDVPLPKGAQAGCPYFFWNGNSKQKSAVTVVEESMSAVFKQSGVEKAHAHRFRHTLATELLGIGATYEEVADVLGNSAKIVEKHYAKWSAKRQNRVDDLMTRLFEDADWSASEDHPETA